jgi:hypothetical protein
MSIVASSSASENLSLLKDRHSQPFTTTWAEDRHYHFSSTPEDNETDLYNYALPFPNRASADWNVCIACDTSYVNPSGLKKHQRDVCERKRTLEWRCPTCRHQVFDELSELHQHHRSMHGDACFACCDTGKSSPSDYCKVLLSQWHINAAKKKAWGCPCCTICFDTLEAWNKHKIVHQVHNEKVVNWSFSTMVHSLLLHRDLLTAFNKYNWSLCSWAHLGKKECQTLRSALERHVLPSNAPDSEAYSHLGILDSLVLHTFTLGNVGNTPAAPFNATTSQAAMNPAKSYSSTSIEQSIGFQPMNLNFQQRGPERRNSHESDGHEQRPLTTSAVAPDEAADCDELTTMDPPFQYRRAIGIVQTRLPDDRGCFDGVQEGPAPLATYVPSSQRGPGAPLKLQRTRLRGERRTPIGKGFYAKHRA